VNLWDAARALITVPVWVGLGLILLVCGVVTFAPPPGVSALTGAIHDVGHVVAFSLLGFCVMRILVDARGTLLPRELGRATLAAITLVAGTVLGVITEELQGLMGDAPSLGDVGRDLLGTAIGTCLVLAGLRRLREGRRPTALLLLAALGLLAGVLPLGDVLLDYRARAASFPVLLDPQQPRLVTLTAAHNAGVSVAPLPPPWRRDAGELALRVPFTGEPWSGLELYSLAPDWRGWRVLRLEVTNPMTVPITLAIRVNDAWHDGRYADRFTEAIVVGAGSRQQYDFVVSDIENAPQDRKLDLARVDKIVLFHSGPAPGQMVYVNRLWLAH
jgi:hypothetical protein